MMRVRFFYVAAILLIMAPQTGHAADEPEKVTSGFPPAPSAEESGNRMERRSNYIEGHIAFLKAELMITPAQEAAWSKVADAMRNDVTEYESAVAKLPQSQNEPSAVESLSQRTEFARLRLKGEERFLSVFHNLYDLLSPEQRKKADDLFATRDDR